MLGQEKESAHSFRVAVSIIENMGDPNERQLTRLRFPLIFQIAEAQVLAGDFDSALETAESLLSGGDVPFKGRLLATIAIEQFQKGDKKRAMDTLEKTSKGMRDNTLGTFAIYLAKKGEIKEAIKTISMMGDSPLPEEVKSLHRNSPCSS